MWPHKKGLGTNLTYGVSGNGSLEIDIKDIKDSKHFRPTTKIKFPRIRNEGLNLHEVKYSYECLTEGDHVLVEYHNVLQSEAESSSRPSSKTSDILKKSAYVPEEIVKSLITESNSLMSPEVFDPTVGELFTIIYFKSSRKRGVTPALVYITNSNILNVSVFKKQSREMRTSSLESNREHRTLTPRLSQPFQTSFSQPVKQIVSSFNANFQNTAHVYLLVRTDYQVYIMDCRSQHIDKNNTNVELNVLVEINTSMHLGINFADASFDKNNCHRIAIVDVKGNVGFWEFSAKESEASASLKKIPLNSQPEYVLLIGEIGDLSNWKKIVSANQSGQYFICSRSSLVYVDISAEIKRSDVVSANSWSRILDLSHSLQQSYLFLLTSKEIIWIDTSSGVKRLLSWKHFLDDRNPSWRLSVRSLNDDNHIICLVYSRVSPIIFVYNFGIIDNKPCSLKDPYFLKSGNLLSSFENDSLQQVFLMDLGEELYDSQSLELQRRLYILFELTTSSSLSYRLFSDIKGLNMKMAKKIEHLNLYQSSKDFSNTHKATYFNLFSKSVFYPIAEKLRYYDGLVLKIDELENYALKISELITALKNGKGAGLDDAKTIYGYHPLDCFVDYVPIARENIEEFDHMLRKLFKCNGGNIVLKNLISTSILSYNRLFEEDDIIRSAQYKNTEVSPISLYCSFRKLFHDTFDMTLNSETLLNKICILLSLSLIKVDLFEQRNLFVEQYENILKDSTSKVRAVADKWGSDYSEQENLETSMTQDLPNDFVTSSIPSIKVTTSERHGNRAGYASQVHEKRSEDNQVSLMSQPVSSSEVRSTQSRQKRSLDRIIKDLANGINKSRIPFLLNNGTRKPKKKKRQGGFA